MPREFSKEELIKQIEEVQLHIEKGIGLFEKANNNILLKHFIPEIEAKLDESTDYLASLLLLLILL